MHHVQFIHGQASEHEVDPGVHSHFGQKGDSLSPGFRIQFGYPAGVAAADKVAAGRQGRPGDGIIKVGRQHTDSNLWCDRFDQLQQSSLPGGVQSNRPAPAVSFTLEKAPHCLRVNVRHHDLGDQVALLQIVNNRLALQA